MCDKDKHLCFNYHEEEEKRRPPNVFEISNEICNMAMPDKYSKFYPHLCQRKDYCNKIHSRYELLYHTDNFKKVKNCTREKINGRCKFYLTCYGIHPEDISNLNLSLKKEIQVSLGDDLTNSISENIREILKNYLPIEEHNKINKKYEVFGCRLCKKICIEVKLGMTKCSHIFCEKCLYSIFSQSEFLCPVCKATIEKKSLMKIIFK
jgi:hypothetical protein